MNVRVDSICSERGRCPQITEQISGWHAPRAVIICAPTSLLRLTTTSMAWGLVSRARGARVRCPCPGVLGLVGLWIGVFRGFACLRCGHLPGLLRARAARAARAGREGPLTGAPVSGALARSAARHSRLAVPGLCRPSFSFSDCGEQQQASKKTQNSPPATFGRLGDSRTLELDSRHHSSTRARSESQK